MRPLNEWLESYSQDHQNIQNQKIHTICVPVIFFSVVGLLHFIPLRVSDISIGDLVIFGALIWYVLLGLKSFLVMLGQLLVSLIIIDIMKHRLGIMPTTFILIGLFVAAWIGQFYGHKLEGKKPSFFTDLQYLLIGPLWIWFKKRPAAQSK